MESPETDTPAVAETPGRYRVHCRVANERSAVRLALFDGERARWITVEEHDDLTDVWPGAVLDGQVRAGRPSGRIDASRVRTAPSLVVGTTPEAVPARVWAAWADREPEQWRVAGVLPGPTEFHVSGVPPDTSWGPLYRRMVTGEFSFEPWFESLVELPDPALDLTVVPVRERAVFVFFATPASTPDTVVADRRARLELADPR